MRREPYFNVDLYRGTAEYYDRFRPGYPPVLTDDLLSRVRPSGRGWLLDLACGTGQIAFALHDSSFSHAVSGRDAVSLIDSGRLADLVVNGEVNDVTMRDPDVAEYVELDHLSRPVWADLTVRQTGC